MCAAECVSSRSHLSGDESSLNSRTTEGSVCMTSIPPGNVMNDQQRTAFGFVRFLIDDYSQYHHQKEQMAYALSVLYLTGASLLLAHKPPFWEGFSAPQFLGFAILLFITAVSGLMFVRWQFDRRLWANDLVATATTLATTWLTNGPLPTDLVPTPIPQRPWGSAGSNLYLPAALVTGFTANGAGRRCLWFPRDLSILLLVFWTLAVFVHLGWSWSPR